MIYSEAIDLLLVVEVRERKCIFVFGFALEQFFERGLGRSFEAAKTKRRRH